LVKGLNLPALPTAGSRRQGLPLHFDRLGVLSLLKEAAFLYPASMSGGSTEALAEVLARSNGDKSKTITFFPTPKTRGTYAIFIYLGQQLNLTKIDQSYSGKYGTKPI
jgi:hypothetical protein